MRKKPAIIWFTLCLCVIFLLLHAYGIIQILLKFQMVEVGEVTVLHYAGVLMEAVVQFALSLAMIYAIWRQARWGHAVAICFSAIFALMALLALLTPDPHPVFVIHEGAEEIGAQIGRISMGIGAIAYALFMAFGRNARTYFSAGSNTAVTPPN